MAASRGHDDYTCRQMVEHATGYLEGSMTATELSTFEIHLNYCNGCAAFVRQLQLAAALASMTGPEELPSELASRLIVTFRTREQR
jgi:hypothetical protein